MRNRIAGYLNAYDKGPKAVEKFHDYHDVCKGKMTTEEYKKKWGKCFG